VEQKGAVKGSVFLRRGAPFYFTLLWYQPPRFFDFLESFQEGGTPPELACHARKDGWLMPWYSLSRWISCPLKGRYFDSKSRPPSPHSYVQVAQFIERLIGSCSGSGNLHSIAENRAPSRFINGTRSRGGRNLSEWEDEEGRIRGIKAYSSTEKIARE